VSDRRRVRNTALGWPADPRSHWCDPVVLPAMEEFIEALGERGSVFKEAYDLDIADCSLGRKMRPRPKRGRS